MNSVNSEQLKKEIEKYVANSGWSGLFGLLASIDPKTIDQQDLEKYKESLRYTEPPKAITTPPVSLLENTNEASIYAKEHLDAVREDMTSTTKVVGRPKSLVLENKNNPDMLNNQSQIEKQSPPNPWGDAVVVTPGQFNNNPKCF